MYGSVKRSIQVYDIHVPIILLSNPFWSREEVEHIKKKIEWKDTQISDLIKENSDLREQTGKHLTNQKTVSFPFLPASQGSHVWSRDTPDSTKEMYAVYEHYDRCVFFSLRQVLYISVR